MNSGCIAETGTRKHLFLRRYCQLSLCKRRKKESHLKPRYDLIELRFKFNYGQWRVHGNGAVWKEPRTVKSMMILSSVFWCAEREANASVLVKNLTSFPCFFALLISSDSLPSSLQIYAAYYGEGKTVQERYSKLERSVNLLTALVGCNIVRSLLTWVRHLYLSTSTRFGPFCSRHGIPHLSFCGCGSSLGVVAVICVCRNN